MRGRITTEEKDERRRGRGGGKEGRARNECREKRKVEGNEEEVS